jgi:hypothetical protein
MKSVAVGGIALWAFLIMVVHPLCAAQQEKIVRVGINKVPLSFAKEIQGEQAFQAFQASTPAAKWLPWDNAPRVQKQMASRCLVAFREEPYVERLRALFDGHFMTARLYPRGARSQDIYTESPIPKEDPHFVLLLLYGEDALRHPLRRGANFSYNPRFRAIILPHFAMSFPWFCARLLHEFGHADKHLVQKKKSALASPREDIWVEEEIEMHELEARVLNRWTFSAYFDVIDRILEQRQFTSVSDLLKKISLADLAMLDTYFPLARRGESNVRLGSYRLILALRLVSQNGGDMQAKIVAYRTVASL